MSFQLNSRQLVLRRDTATGMTLVGWDAELPLGRFEHLELICESDKNRLPECDSEDYVAYQSALHQARQANKLLIEQQFREHRSKGYYLVPFELATHQDAMQADCFGNFSTAATQLQYQLTHNRKHIWAVTRGNRIVHVRARYPLKDLDEFTYQVWYHKQRYELGELDGTLLEGYLIICESGLWFESI